MLASVKLFLGTVALLTILGALAACTRQALESEHRESRMERKTIEEVLKQHTDRLMSLPGVVGTAIGECEGKPCIKVLVVKKTPELLKKIPPKLEGFSVSVEETGEIRRLDTR